MTDFYQTGIIATLHRLKETGHERLERELEGFAGQCPVALVLPARYEDFEDPALPGILEHLEEVRYLREIVITLDGAGAAQFEAARRAASRLPQEVRFVWNGSPGIQGLYGKLASAGLAIGEEGKGRSCWMAFGYLLASRRSGAIVVHDCDILSYDRELLARLCYPVVHPGLGYEFCKGYYARVTDRMHGRATRLLVTPLLRSLTGILGHLPLLEFLDSFRYALAGEFAMKADLARMNRIPPDWGLELGVLSEVFRNCAAQRVCQAELCAAYDHRPRALSPEDPSQGLMKMAVDICKSLFRALAAEGAEFTSGVFRTLQSSYLRTAEDTLTRYQADAQLDGLVFDRHLEEVTVEAFARAIRLAAEAFREDPSGQPLIPNWNRITAALPEFLDELKAQVDFDSARP